MCGQQGQHGVLELSLLLAGHLIQPPVQSRCTSSSMLNHAFKTAGLEISGFLFNSQFKPQPRLRAPSFKEATPPVSAAVSAGKVR